MSMTTINFHEVVKVEVLSVNKTRGVKDCPDHDTRDIILTDKNGNSLKITAFGEIGALGLTL